MTKSQGLTIIEALISVAVLGVVFVALAAIQISSLRLTADARVESALLSEAVTAFEAVRTVVLQDFERYRLACAPLAGAACVDDAIDGAVSESGGVERVELSAAVFDGDVFPGLLRVRIVVRDLRAQRSLTLVQYVSCLDGDEVALLSDPVVCGVIGD